MLKFAYIVYCLTILVTVYHHHSNATSLNMYEHSNYGGEWSYCENLDNAQYCNIRIMNNKASSIKITTGTCVRLNDLSPPGGQLVVIGYPQYNYPHLGTCCNFNDKLSAVESCYRTIRTLRCPSRTFVKKFAVRSFDSLSQFEAQCFTPGNNTHPSSVLKSHDVVSVGNPLQCFGAIRGINYGVYVGRMVYINITGRCERIGAKTCGPNEAVCGFVTEIEEHTNLIKDFSVQCCDVGNPAEICNPDDFYELIMTCDALGAVAPSTCSYSQTIGIGNSTSEGSSSQIEYGFYTEFGYNFGASGYGLSANFHRNLGTSNKTTFNWNTASSTTWQMQVTTEISMEIPPCVKTELFQVVGECSFFSVHATYFKRVDTTCNGTTTETFGSYDSLILGLKPSAVATDISI